MTIADELEKLNKLHAEGALTDEEFQQAKLRLLNGDSADGTILGLSETTWCVLMHLSQLLNYSVLGIAVPIAMWLIGRDKSQMVRVQGAYMMNWLLSFLIYAAVSFALTFVVIGVPMLLVLVVLSVVFPIIAAVKAANNEAWRYPLSIQFFSPEEGPSGPHPDASLSTW